MIPPALETIHGEPSVSLISDRVRAWITLRGGMIAPVEFTLSTGDVVRPYSLSPWLPQTYAAGQPPLLQVLRGDFFCFPFGADNPSQLPHGPAANGTWSLIQSDHGRTEFVLESDAPKARLRKRVHLRPGETNLYQEHTITAEGRFNFGHHPILQIPEGSTAQVRTSPFGFGGVYGEAPGDRPALLASARFSQLDSVPLASGGTTSLARYPLRARTEDIVMLSKFAGGYAWSAVTFDRYVWFALRRVSDFPSTLFWMSHGGRDASPWEGRHTGRIGIEDVCSYYCDGPARSAQDLLADEGIVTSRQFTPDVPVVLRHVQGVVAVPPNFGGVAAIEPVLDDPTLATLRGENGAEIPFKLDWSFLPTSAASFNES